MTADSTSSRSAFQEEEWEAEIGSLLAAMPPVDPPLGFIDRAIDHRPKYAGRTSVLAVVASVLALVLAASAGLMDEEEFVPDLDALVSQHSATEATLLSGILPGTMAEGSSQVFVLLDETNESDDTLVDEVLVVLPSDFSWHAAFEDNGVRQGVLASEDETVSVFREPGQVNFAELPSEGLTEVGGVTAWSDPERDLTIVQTRHGAVTIVGLSPDLMPEVVQSLEAEKSSLWGGLSRGLNRLTHELGFPNLGG